MKIARVEGHTHLVRDLKTQAIVNTDSDAYARYMARKAKQGLWSGEFVTPWDWRKGKRLP